MAEVALEGWITVGDLQDLRCWHRIMSRVPPAFREIRYETYYEGTKEQLFSMSKNSQLD